MTKKQNVKIQLSMFPRFICEICGDKLNHNGTTCQPCAKEWIDKVNTKHNDKND